MERPTIMYFHSLGLKNINKKVVHQRNLVAPYDSHSLWSLNIFDFLMTTFLLIASFILSIIRTP